MHFKTFQIFIKKNTENKNFSKNVGIQLEEARHHYHKETVSNSFIILYWLKYVKNSQFIGVLCLLFTSSLISYFKQALKSDFIVFFVAGKMMRFNAKNSAIRKFTFLAEPLVKVEETEKNITWFVYGRCQIPKQNTACGPRFAR